MIVICLFFDFDLIVLLCVVDLCVVEVDDVVVLLLYMLMGCVGVVVVYWLFECVVGDDCFVWFVVGFGNNGGDVLVVVV